MYSEKAYLERVTWVLFPVYILNILFWNIIDCVTIQKLVLASLNISLIKYTSNLDWAIAETF